MSEQVSPPAAVKEAPQKHLPVSAFKKGHHVGRKKGSKDRRRIAGQAAAAALEAKAWDVVAALLECRGWRARLESAKVVLSYSIGLPRATLELTGGFGDLSRELAAALAEARARRAGLDAPSEVPALGPVKDAELVTASHEQPKGLAL